MGDITENFSRSEFECHCGCGKDDIDLDFVEDLQFIRYEVDRVMKIVSGCRCFGHNLEVGGKKKSDHLVGGGADVHCTSSIFRFLLVQAAFRQGVQRIGVYKTFIHLGKNPNNPQKVYWVG